jgi:GTP-binding protein
MIDYVEIYVRGGKGGRGAVAFRKIKGKPYGPSEGGDGGAGGNVILKGTEDQGTLLDYRFKKDFQADDGLPGGTANKTGRSGDDLILKVPVGTVVWEKVGDKRKLVLDILNKNMEILAARGGRGGRGNARLKPRRAGPSVDWEMYRRFEEGEEGEKKLLVLELKLLADVGLIGLPNAGKSTLLSRLTKAQPKIASYPFTTLEPNLGVGTLKGNELTFADIPGLIAGASRGKGLGDRFLRHIERTKILLHLVSSESADPVSDYLTVKKELREYNKDLLKKPEIVLVSKIDLVNDVGIASIINSFSRYKVKPLAISAVTGRGMDELEKELLKAIRRSKVEFLS